MSRPSLPVRLLRGFGRFWWDLLVGDTPELFVAVVLIVAAVAVVARAGHLNALAVVSLPVLAVAALGVSIARAARRRT